jgi:heat shock transcription factor
MSFTPRTSVNRFSTLDTPSTIPSTPHSVEAFSQAQTLDIPSPPANIPSRIIDATSESPPPSLANTQRNPTPDAPYSNQTFSDLSQNMLAPIPQNSSSSTDAVLQALLNSPQQLQKLLGVLNLQQGFPSGPSFEVPQHPSSTTAASTGDPSMFSHSPFSPMPSSVDLVEPLDDSPNYLSLLRNDDNTSFGPILDNSSKLHKSYRDASDIHADVDALQSSIDALIENLGLNPAGLNGTATSDATNPPDDDAILNRNQSSSSGGAFYDNNQHHVPEGSNSSIPDFDVEAFMRELDHQQGTSDIGTTDLSALDENSNANTLSDRLSAYVDEVNSQSDASSPGVTRISLDENPADVNSRKKHSKRKSDIAEISPDAETSTRPKRKR